jgi:hypothetical protein
MTSIGAGIEMAQAQFTADGLPHAIVLLSDGFSNTAPYEYDSPDASEPVVNADFIATGTVIYSVALGATADTTRLENVATATGGQFFQIDGFSDVSSLHENYYNIQALAAGDDLVELDSDEVSDGDTNTHEADVEGDSDEAFFGVSSDSDDDGITFSLISPSGEIFKPGTTKAIYRAGEGYRFYRVSRPQGGKWKLVVSKKMFRPKSIATFRTAKAAAAPSAPVPYTYAVIGQSGILFDWQLSGIPVVGTALDLSVVLHQKGKTLSDMRVTAVTKRLDKPISEYLRIYKKQLAAIKLPSSVKGDKQDMARLTLLDQKMKQEGRGIFNYVTGKLSLKETEPGMYSVNIPAQKYDGVQKIFLEVKGTYGRDQKNTFTRKVVLTANIKEKAATQENFRISELQLRKKVGVRPGDSKFRDYLRRKSGIVVFNLVDGKKNPLTPSSGAMVSGSLKLPGGKSQKLSRIFYSFVLGGYYILLPKVKGEVDVNVKAVLGDVTRNAAAHFTV